MNQQLSIVVPLRNEAGTVEELASRCAGAARAIGRPFEVLLVDDASNDGTGPCIDALPRELNTRRIALERRHGQFAATREGLRRAGGDIVVVLDGDLQDPPELIPALVTALLDEPASPVAFAVKATRDDPRWFLAGRALFGALLRLVEGRGAPSGSGSFVAMRAALARRVAAVPVATCNLAAVVGALGAEGPAVPYQKAARCEGDSRVGVYGLVREALGSLAVASPPGRWLVRRRLRRGSR